jgi:hypothetical protein
MKLIRLIIFLLIVAAAIFVNIQYLKIGWIPFIGLFLVLWLAYGFISNFIVKLYKNKKGIPQEKYSYAFPDKIAKVMKKVDMRTQLESSLLSMSFIVVGMIAFNIYILFFMKFDWWFKGLTLFNSICGMFFLITSIIGQYQSYVTYMQTMESLKTFGEQGNIQHVNLNEMKGGPIK